MTNKVYANNPYDSIGSGIGGALQMGQLFADNFQKLSAGMQDSPDVDRNNLTFDSSTYEQNMDQADAFRADAKGRVGRGALQGAGSGAAIGGAVGSIVPGVGTVIGAGVGAGIGSIAGTISGIFGANRRRKKARKIERESTEQFEGYIDSFNRASESNASQTASRRRLEAIQNSYSFPTSMY